MSAQILTFSDYQQKCDESKDVPQIMRDARITALQEIRCRPAAQCC
jgi:hypothetical protein